MSVGQGLYNFPSEIFCLISHLDIRWLSTTSSSTSIANCPLFHVSDQQHFEAVN